MRCRVTSLSRPHLAVQSFCCELSLDREPSSDRIVQHCTNFVNRDVILYRRRRKALRYAVIIAKIQYKHESACRREVPDSLPQATEGVNRTMSIVKDLGEFGPK